jgi:hypothetical protein
MIKVASNGLVLTIGRKGAEHASFELTGYKQYKQWARHSE